MSLPLLLFRQHHLIPTGWIGEVKGDKVVLIKNSEEVKQQWHAI